MLRSLVAAGILLATLGLAAAPAQTSQGAVKPGLLAFAPDQRIWQIAFTDRYLTWESEQGEEGTPALVVKDLPRWRPAGRQSGDLLRRASAGLCHRAEIGGPRSGNLGA